MPKPLTKERLDQMKCATPGCKCGGHDGFFFQGRCHGSDRVTVFHDAGILTVQCAECGRTIAEIEVVGLTRFGFIKARCHQTVTAFYQHGKLMVSCAKCNRPVETITVC